MKTGGGSKTESGDMEVDREPELVEGGGNGHSEVKSTRGKGSGEETEDEENKDRWIDGNGS